MNTPHRNIRPLVCLGGKKDGLAAIGLPTEVAVWRAWRINLILVLLTDGLALHSLHTQLAGNDNIDLVLQGIVRQLPDPDPVELEVVPHVN